MNKETKVHLLKKLDVTDLSGEKVMVDFESGKYFLLKGAANEIWDMLTDDITISQIQCKLMEVYDVDENTCLTSIVEFLQQMEGNGFVALQNA